jgi:hypothetical protein
VRLLGVHLRSAAGAGQVERHVTEPGTTAAAAERNTPAAGRRAAPGAEVCRVRRNRLGIGLVLLLTAALFAGRSVAGVAGDGTGPFAPLNRPGPMGTYDPAAAALVVDAFTQGLADPARVPSAVCERLTQPAVDPLTFAADYADFLAAIVADTAHSREVSHEPPLARYVWAR